MRGFFMQEASIIQLYFTQRRKVIAKAQRDSDISGISFAPWV